MVNLNDLTVVQLKKVLLAYDLSQTGLKNALIIRLQEHFGTEVVEDFIINDILSANNTTEQIETLKNMLESVTNAFAVMQENIKTRDDKIEQLENKLTGLTQNENPQPLNQDIIENATRNASAPSICASVPIVDNMSVVANDDDSTENVAAEETVSKTWHNVRDVIAVLPEFDPVNGNLTSTQFIEKINCLSKTYAWPENMILYAAQCKLKGHAKVWSDAQPVLNTWNEFVTALQTDFPSEISVADIHIELVQRSQGRTETATDYYYAMLALGRRGKLDDRSIIQHMINGLYDQNLKKSLKVLNFRKCPELFTALRANGGLKAATQPLMLGQRTFINRDQKPQFNKIGNVTNGDLKIERKPPICYNCSKEGHISINCPEPQKKARCQKCNKTNHSTANCPQPNTNVYKINDGDEPTLTKEIVVNGRQTTAFIDPGSNKTLIQSSLAYELAQTTSCHIMLKGFAGGKFECVEQVNVTLQIDDKSYNVIMLVVEDTMIPEKVLLGRDVLCQDGYRLTIENHECHLENVFNIEAVNYLDTDEQGDLEKLLCEYKNVFATDVSELGRCTKVQMEIELTSTEPVQLKPYRIPFPRRLIVNKAVDELLKYEVVRPSKSPYASPVVLVMKTNGEPRICVDYRCLNAITKKIPFPMPLMEEQFAQLAGNKYFTTLDLRMGYHQVEIAEKSKPYTAFVTNDGHYEYNRMPFGLVNAPGVFQALMNQLGAKMNPGEVLTYLDDVIIPSKTVKEGLERLKKFFLLLTEYGLTLRMDKCKFLVNEINHLGYIVSENGIKPGERKITAITEFKTPSSQTEVRRFLGLTGFFRKFVPEYALLVEPLTTLLRKDKEFSWGKNQQDSFMLLIEKLTNAPILQLYDINAMHEVHTDASAIGIAGVLLQSSTGKKWNPVCYFSRRCTEYESKCHSYELEVLAVVETLERFRIYLLGKSFRLVTDCAAIATTKKQKELKPKIARWWIKLLEYDFTIIHRQGSKLAHVDALSRAPTEPATIVEEARFVLSIDEKYSDWLLTMQIQDEKIQQIYKILKGLLVTDQRKQVLKDYEIRDGRVYRKTDDGSKFVVPKAVRWRVVEFCHDKMGHFSLQKTSERIKRRFWFPKMTKYVKDYIAACIDCCYNKTRGGKSEGELHLTEIVPIPFTSIHIDHLGPFVRSKRGNTHVLAISDAFTKYLIVKPVRSTKTAPVINILNEITSYFGLPKKITTDRGTAYTSKMFEDYCQHSHIQHIKNAVRTPRANGQVERANKIILDYLRTTVEHPKDWDLSLRELQWAVNTQRNSTTNYTPNQLLFDFNLRDITKNVLTAALEENDEPGEITIDVKRKNALQNIRQEREKWKERFDQKHASPTIYQLDDLVVLQNEPAATGESRKLEPRYKGPFIITKILDNDRYLIENIPGTIRADRKFCSVYSSDKMKPWCSLMPDPDIDDESDYDELSADVHTT